MKPKVVVAKTIKGKGVSFMENNRLLFSIDVILIMLILWMLVEGLIILIHDRNNLVEL